MDPHIWQHTPMDIVERILCQASKDQVSGLIALSRHFYQCFEKNWSRIAAYQADVMRVNWYGCNRLHEDEFSIDVRLSEGGFYEFKSGPGGACVIRRPGMRNRRQQSSIGLPTKMPHELLHMIHRRCTIGELSVVYHHFDPREVLEELHLVPGLRITGLDMIFNEYQLFDSGFGIAVPEPIYGEAEPMADDIVDAMRDRFFELMRKVHVTKKLGITDEGMHSTHF